MRAEDLGNAVDALDNHKRADYILERGTWKAVCRSCRFTLEHPDKQRASVLFRNHHREVLNAAPSAPIVDLRTDSARQPAPIVIGLGQEQNTA